MAIFQIRHLYDGSHTISFGPVSVLADASFVINNLGLGHIFPALSFDLPLIIPQYFHMHLSLSRNAKIGPFRPHSYWEKDVSEVSILASDSPYK
jgi:hypothetical protein